MDCLLPVVRPFWGVTKVVCCEPLAQLNAE